MTLDSHIDFIVRGKVGDLPISPKTIELSLLKTFSEDIFAIINSIPETKNSEPIVSIEQSSFKARVHVALIAANMVLADAETLNQTNDLSTINSVRSKIIEKWAEKSKNNNSLEFEIRPKGEDGIKVNFEKNFTKSQENIWVEAEIYLYGEVTDWGGSSKSNIHFTTEDKKKVTVACRREDLINQKDNLVYRPGGIRVLAKQNLYTGEIKDAKFVAFIDYSPIYDEAQLNATIEKGREAWKDVKDHVEWVRNLRTDG
jgi:hypothetical protein